MLSLAPTQPLLTVQNLAAWRGDTCLFADLEFSVAPQNILHVRGANGSGKTTLLRILCGLRPPHEGRIEWRGVSIEADRESYHGDLAFLGHHDGVKLELTALQNVNALVGLRAGTVLSSAEDALITVGLASAIDLPARVLSAGQRRRVALAALVCRQLTLWILDEPFNALDPEGVELVGNILGDHRDAGGAAILTSHQSLPDGLIPTDHLDLQQWQ